MCSRRPLAAIPCTCRRYRSCRISCHVSYSWSRVWMSRRGCWGRCGVTISPPLPASPTTVRLPLPPREWEEGNRSAEEGEEEDRFDDGVRDRDLPDSLPTAAAAVVGAVSGPLLPPSPWRGSSFLLCLALWLVRSSTMMERLQQLGRTETGMERVSVCRE